MVRPGFRSQECGGPRNPSSNLGFVNTLCSGPVGCGRWYLGSLSLSGCCRIKSGRRYRVGAPHPRGSQDSAGSHVFDPFSDHPSSVVPGSSHPPRSLPFPPMKDFVTSPSTLSLLQSDTHTHHRHRHHPNGNFHGRVVMRFNLRV